MEAIILAGGLGRRLSEVVVDTPKPMALVNGRPFLEYLFAQIVDAGVSRIVVSVGYLASQITSYFGDAFRGVPLVYVAEQEPLGTGGAIAMALMSCEADRILVLNGDTLLNAPLATFYSACVEADARLGIVVRGVDDVSRYGACTVDGGIVVGFGEKMGVGRGLINAGVYCVTSDLFQGYSMPPRFSFEQDFIAPFLQRLKPIGFPVDGYFIDIGVPADYQRAQVEFAQANWLRVPGATT